MAEKEKDTGSFGNICTVLGGTLLGMAIVDKVTKNLDELDVKKLMSGDIVKDLKLLPSSQEEKSPDKPSHHEQEEQERERKHNDERKSHEDEMSKLKRELEEYKAKEKGQQE